MMTILVAVAVVLAFLALLSMFLARPTRFSVACIMLGAAPAFAFDFKAEVGAVAVAGLVAAVANPVTWAVVAVALLMIVKHFSASKAALINDLMVKAYYIVEDLKATDKLPPFANKAEIALAKFKDLADNKGLSVTDLLEEEAKAFWQAYHGEQKSKAEIAASAGPPAPAGS